MHQRHVLSQCFEQYTSLLSSEGARKCSVAIVTSKTVQKRTTIHAEFLDFWSAVRFRGDVEGKSEFCQMGFYHDGGKRCNLPYMHLGSCTDTCLKTNPNFRASCILNDNLLGVLAKVVFSWTRLYREFSFPCIRNQLIYLRLRLGKIRKKVEE